MNVEKEVIGTGPEGDEVELFTLTNDNGLKVKIMTFGAVVTAVEVPDRDGKVENVTLGLDSLDDYIARNPFLGSTVGRFANRIGGAKFTLDGVEYTLAANNGENHLHGGEIGFDKHIWQTETISTSDSVGVKFSRISPDGEEGYPGTLTTAVTYSLTANDELVMDYSAETDKPTIVNLTNHAYWNLAGPAAGDVLQHELMINGPSYLPVDKGLIPTGAVASVTGTPLDFTTPHKIGEHIEEIGGYDHCYVLAEAKAGMPLAARVVEPGSGRVMEVYTTQPGIQLYTSNHFDGTLSAFGVTYQKYHAFCLETQHYPDSPNKPDFPTTVLRPGEKYQQTTLHKFSTQ
jgi:aldose 1-epimerase